MNKILNKLDKNIMALLQNNVVRLLLLLLAISYLFMIKKIPSRVLNMYNNLYVRVLIALIIAYMACFEPFYSVVVASLFILSLQELHNRRVNNENRMSLQVNMNKIMNKRNSNNNADLDHVLGDNKIAKMNKNVFLEEQVLNKNTDVKIKNIKEDRDISVSDPAYSTLTNNVSYITNKNLIDAQSNMICGSDPDAPVEVFPKILNAQGLNEPSGFNAKASRASKF